MKYLPSIAGAVLGLLFLMSSLVILLKVPVTMPPPPPAGSAEAMFMGALGTTGYLTFVKLCELLGGVLVAIPRTRNYGLLVLGPIILNILAFDLFIKSGGPHLDAMIVVIAGLALYLLWAGRRAFAGLSERPAAPIR